MEIIMNEFKQVFFICVICAGLLVVGEMDYNDPITNPVMHEEASMNIAHEDTKELFCEMVNRDIIKYDIFGDCR